MVEALNGNQWGGNHTCSYSWERAMAWPGVASAEAPGSKSSGSVTSHTMLGVMSSNTAEKNCHPSTNTQVSHGEMAND